MKITTILAGMLTATVLLCGCSARQNAGDGKRVLTVSIPPQAYMLERLAGDKFAVECMLSKGGNAETYDPTMSDMMHLEKSVAYFFIGNIGFEYAIKEKIGEYSPDMRRIDSSAGVTRLKGHHFDAHDAEGIDPHVWTSVSNVRIIVRNMYEALLSLDAANSAYYTERYRRFDGELKTFGDSLAQVLAPVRGRAFAVWHPSLSYFAHDYGLEQISVEYSGKEAPVRYVEDKVRYARERGVRVFLYEKGTDPRQFENFSRQIGAEQVEMSPMGYDWKNEMRHIANVLAR